LTGPDRDKPGRNGGETTRAAAARTSVGKESLKAPLAKRFYSTSAAVPIEGGHAVMLDGHGVKTPAKNPLIVPTGAVASSIAAEWAAQGTYIEPATMPLTRLANTVLDAVAPSRDAVAADIVAFAGTDALCYRAEGPLELAARQAACWDPILAWAEGTLGARLAVTRGILHVTQPAEALAAISRNVGALDPWQLAPLHVMTTLTGSALLALAVARGACTAEEAWAAAHVDDDWQIEHWGADEEAASRGANRWVEMAAAARFLDLVRQE